MFTAIVDKAYRLLLLQVSVYGHVSLIFTRPSLYDLYIVNGLPISVMHCETIPIVK
ncbi:MAG: hypothetical protein QG555_184 [Thermodesulfobacteriota bacterium]|nr:hypothetical protein [Thermodesulfobacteriota bacterium]